MSEPAPSKSLKSTPAEAATVDLPFELMVRELWTKPENRTTIYAAVIVVLVGIIGWGVYREVRTRREEGIEASFAAATTPAKLQAFVRENETHPLAGAGYLQLGDEAYAAARFDEARTDYEKAAAVLPGTPFAARAMLGEGICLLQTGKVAEGLALLQRLSADTTQLPAVRCEAAYHLAALAFSNRQFDDVVKFVNLIAQVDPNGIWAQRAVLLQMRTPASAAAPAAAPAPATGGAAPSMAIKVPGT